MHVLNEVFAEGDEEEYSQYASEERAEEYLEEVDRNVGILGLKDVERGQGEYGTATITPEQAPIDWMITFCPRASFLPSALDSPTAMMAIGIAASNTWPTRNPR